MSVRITLVFAISSNTTLQEAEEATRSDQSCLQSSNTSILRLWSFVACSQLFLGCLRSVGSAHERNHANFSVETRSARQRMHFPQRQGSRRSHVMHCGVVVPQNMHQVQSHQPGHGNVETPENTHCALLAVCEREEREGQTDDDEKAQETQVTCGLVRGWCLSASLAARTSGERVFRGNNGQNCIPWVEKENPRGIFEVNMLAGVE
jgi:hypothetical protein